MVARRAPLPAHARLVAGTLLQSGLPGQQDPWGELFALSTSSRMYHFTRFSACSPMAVGTSTLLRDHHPVPDLLLFLMQAGPPVGAAQWSGLRGRKADARGPARPAPGFLAPGWCLVTESAAG